MTTANIIHLTKYFLPYLLYDIPFHNSNDYTRYGRGPENNQVYNNIITFTQVIAQTILAESHLPSADYIQQKQKQILSALYFFSKQFPRTELACQVHNLVHLVKQFQMWGPAREIWCFSMERFCTSTTSVYTHIMCTVTHLPDFFRTMCTHCVHNVQYCVLQSV